MWPGVLYTCNNDTSHNNDADNDDATAQLHLSWPFTKSAKDIYGHCMKLTNAKTNKDIGIHILYVFTCVKFELQQNPGLNNSLQTHK